MNLRQSSILIALFFLVASVAIGVVGCAGDGVSESLGHGRLAVSVRWPSTREIPPATRSLKVVVKTLVKNQADLKVEDVTLGEKLIARPAGASTSTATIEDLPSVEVRVRVLAFVSTDGSGTPLAEGFSDVTITESGTTDASVTLHAEPGGCSEYSVSLDGQEQTSGSLPLDFHVGDSIAQASEFGGLAQLFHLSAGTEHGKTYYRVHAPNATGPITLNLHYSLAVQNFNPGPDRSASVSISWPGGSKSLDATGTFEADVPITVRDGDLLFSSGDISVRADMSNFAVYGAYAITFQDALGGTFPGGLLVRLNC